jgi:hypothetical protein
VPLIVRTLRVALLAAVVAAAGSCHPKKDTGECVEDQTHCLDNDQVQTCIKGKWETTRYCSTGCSDQLGCIQCDPAQNGGLACGANNVFECLPDGTLGTLVEACADQSVCRDGECKEPCTTDGLDLIYVVDETYRLLSFDPRLLDAGGQPFKVVGDLRCPTQYPNVPGWGGGGAPTPFSMTVDREGYAWVLYTSGEISRVDIQDASCESTAFQRLQPGSQGPWAVFGMGYSSDEPGSDSEHLYISGGSPTAAPGGMFGVIDPDTLAIATLGSVPADAEYSPEFTGNGKAELFGYFPGTSATIRQIDRGSGQQLGDLIDAGTVVGGARAWAFAYWGEKFYIFITDASCNSQVMRSDRETGDFDGVMLSNLPYIIVGAGVSTCVPTIVGN